MRVAPPDLSKVELRRAIRAERRSLQADIRRRLTRAALTAVCRSRRLAHDRRVGIYLPIDCELDPAALIAEGRRRGVEFYVPIIKSLRSRSMRFALLEGPMRRRYLGLKEPRRARVCLDPRWLSTILVPIVAIDSHGFRLGMGAGFFDRALIFRRHRHHWRGPLLLALGFDMQRIDRLPHDPWDAALDGIATESGIHWVRRSLT
jgi:5-formyltetrahydrofolate cyclo-ligase